MTKYIDNLIELLDSSLSNNSSREIAKTLIEWNQSYLEKGAPDEKVSTSISKLLNSDKFKVAFRLNGNLGSILVRTNIIKKIVSLVSRKIIDVTVFGHPKSEINQEIFSDLDFIDHVKNYCELKVDDKSYHLIIDLDTFPTVIYRDEQAIRSKVPVFVPMLKKWDNFKDQHKEWFKNISDFRPQIYTLAKMNRKNCINNIDIDGYLRLEKHFIYSISCDLNAADVMRKFNIKGEFITLNRGSYTIANQAEGTRVWPLEYYSQLVQLLKQRYPQIQLVQLGESEECSPIVGIDLNLCGQTSLAELKALLSAATLHIDGEGGMPHLRRALNAGPSVVLFGSTPREYFGYDGNINLASCYCAESCCELHKNWLHRCLLTNGEALCLKELKPAYVFKCIVEYLTNGDHVQKSPDYDGLYEGTYKFIHDKSFILDSTWVEEFVKPRAIYNYFKENIKIGDLFCMYYTRAKVWEKKPISESNCLTFLRGNKKEYEQYNKFKNDTYAKDSIHSNERFSNLIKQLNKKHYNPRYPIIVDGRNVIMDGQHRACWLLNKYGPDYEVQVIKIYGDWRME